MINEHTRVECRVLCALARGGQVREVRAELLLERLGPLVEEHPELVDAIKQGAAAYDTGPKRNAAGQTKREFVEAGGDKADFNGVRVTFDAGLHQRLREQGFITEAGNIAKAGREHLDAVHQAAREIVGLPADKVAAAIQRHRFRFGGQSIADAVRNAESICDVCHRLAPGEEA